MRSTISLTLGGRAIRFGGYIFILSLFITTACKKGSVTEVAQANPNPPATSPTPGTIQVPVAGNTVASPTPNLPQPSGVPAQLPAGPSGIATPAPGAVPGATPDPAPNMRHLNNGKMITVEGTQGAKDFPTPPPTPTPTPAPTPTIEMVNGKVKQQWEAPAEYAGMKSPLKVSPDIIKRGQYLYKNRCEICHGAEGKGNGFYNKPEYKQSTNLASKVVQANTDGELFYKVTTNRDRHPSSRMLYSDEERWMIVAFLRTFK